MRAVQHHGALADTPLAMRFSPLNTHANPLYGTWASLSARGPAIPSLGNPAHVRDRRPTCGIGGPDVDGAVTSLITYGAVTVAWVERLAAINEEMVGFFDEELAELREGLSGT